MNSSMKQQTIEKKPPWWKRRSVLQRALVLCVILLCTALAVIIAVFVLNSGLGDDPDRPAEMLSSKAEPLIRRRFFWKRHKKMKTVTSTADPPQHGTKPLPEKPRTTRPKDVVASSAAPPRGGIKPVSEQPSTIKPKEVSVSTAAPRRNATVPTRKPIDKDDVCYTAGCNRTASMILADMDPSVDPCDDFYSYACGGFVNSTKIPRDKGLVNTFTLAEDELQDELKKIIEADIAPDEHSSFKRAKTFYKSCIDSKSNGVEKLRSIFELFGGWAGVHSDSASGTDSPDAKPIFDRLSCSGNYIIKIEVDVDKKNSTQRVIYLDQPDFGIPQVYLTGDEKWRKAYYSYMVDIAVLLGAIKIYALNDLSSVLDFEKELAKISSPVDERLDEAGLYNRMTLSEFNKHYGNVFNLADDCSSLLEPTIKLRPDEIVIVKSHSYFAQLGKLLSRSTNRDLLNYLLWRLVMESTGYLNDEIRKRSSEFAFSLTGRTNSPPRWKECLDVVSNSLPLTVNAMYLKKYYDADDVKDADKIVTNIARGITDMLRTIDWMNANVNEQARIKAALVSNINIDMDKLMNEAILEESNSTLDFDTYVQEELNLTRKAKNFVLKKLRQPVKKFNWAYHKRATAPQVYYAKSDNSILLPAAILRSPFFSDDQPGYMNYGAIGFLVGHQLTYGFDYNGIRYNENGNFDGLMDSETKNQYAQRARCLAEKYDKYIVEEADLRIDGRATVIENTADSGGLKSAYFAYNNYISKNGKDKKLPGIDGTPKQLFWISAANVLCSKYTPNALKHQIRTGAHSPAEFRVLGAMSNVMEFGIDFKCPPDSRMNPVDKCSVS